jgi:hypothetical protein
MKAVIALTSLVAGVLTLAPPAVAHPDAQKSCIWTRDLRNHTVGDDHTLYFNVGGRSVLRVEMSGACLAGISSSDPIVLRDRASTGQICSPLDVDISARGSHCIVTGMTRLTPEEAAALPRRIRP